MSVFKGTKGKWKAVNNGPHWNNQTIDNWVIEWSEDGELVSDHVYDQYDALLISKAPEMLEMLEKMVDIIDRIHPDIKPIALLSLRMDAKELIKEATTL